MSLYVPALQAEHACDPIPALYVPLSQGVQAAPLGPVKPALHLQSSTVLPFKVEKRGHISTAGTMGAGGGWTMSMLPFCTATPEEEAALLTARPTLSPISLIGTTRTRVESAADSGLNALQPSVLQARTRAL